MTTPDHRPTITPRLHNYAAKPCPRCYMPMRKTGGVTEHNRQPWNCDNCGCHITAKAGT